MAVRGYVIPLIAGSVASLASIMNVVNPKIAEDTAMDVKRM
jgi:hypothetical protein